MTTDTTELAQSLKAAAGKATPGPWVALTDTATRTFSVHTPDDKRCDDVIKWTGFDGQRKAKANAKFIALANPANILALVEALEKAQQRIASQREYYEGVIADGGKRIAELESRTVKLPPKIERDDADGWFTYKGGRVGGGAAEWYNKALDDVGAASASTGTVKLPDDEDGQAYGFGKWANRAIPATAGTMMISYCEDAWRAAFEVFSNAAGIKWEAE